MKVLTFDTPIIGDQFFTRANVGTNLTILNQQTKTEDNDDELVPRAEVLTPEKVAEISTLKSEVVRISKEDSWSVPEKATALLSEYISVADAEAKKHLRVLQFEIADNVDKGKVLAVIVRSSYLSDMQKSELRDLVVGDSQANTAVADASGLSATLVTDRKNFVDHVITYRKTLQDRKLGFETLINQLNGPLRQSPGLEEIDGLKSAREAYQNSRRNVLAGLKDISARITWVENETALLVRMTAEAFSPLEQKLIARNLYQKQ